MQGIQQTGNNTTASNTAANRGADYVVFQRMPQQAFSRAGLEKATAAKLKLEHYYKKAVDDVVERNARWVTLLSWAGPGRLNGLRSRTVPDNA